MRANRKIFIRVHGGLGNQLFQYAYSLYIANKCNFSNVYYDRFHYSGDVDRPLSILNFNLSSFNLLKSNYNRFGNSKINRIYNLLFNRKRYIIEGFSKLSSEYVPNLSSDGDIYFDGYWQKLYIIEAVQDLLRKEFILKYSLSKKIVSTKNFIASHTNSVSLHIRKTDFISTKENKSIFAICSVDYYYRAVQFILENISQNIMLFIFSDDFEWVKSNLNFKLDYFFVEGNLDFEDLYLMSLCRHNIISNSTFSWWAAWLNSNNNKVVISPEKWFENGSSIEDLIPSSWVRIKN
jgi:hypothetical protein